MKRDIVTVRLDSGLKPMLDRASRQLSRSRSDIVRDALRRHLMLLQFERLRGRVAPFAEAQGYLTDEDIFKTVS